MAVAPPGSPVVVQPPDPAEQTIHDAARAELERRREADAAAVYDAAEAERAAQPSVEAAKEEAQPPVVHRDVKPDNIARIPARSFTAGRPAQVRLVVLHTTENDLRSGVARAVASWFGGPDAPQASSHYVVDADETILCVLEQDQAWGAPGANGDGIHVEICARAGLRLSIVGAHTN